MRKRVLLVSVDGVLADAVGERLRRMACSVARVATVREAIERVRLANPHAVVAGRNEEASQTAYDVRDELRKSDMLSQVPMVLCDATVEPLHPKRERQVDPTAGGDAVVQALEELVSGISPPASAASMASMSSPRTPAAQPPPVPPAAGAGRPRLPPPPTTSRHAAPSSMWSGSMTAAAQALDARALAAQPSSESGVMSAVQPGADPITPERGSSQMPAVGPSRNSSSTMAALDLPALRREINDQRVRNQELARRLARAEARAKEISDALALTVKERDEADAAWTAWVTAAETMADDLWKQRLELEQRLGGVLLERDAVRDELSQAGQRIAELESNNGDLEIRRTELEARIAGLSTLEAKVDEANGRTEDERARSAGIARAIASMRGEWADERAAAKARLAEREHKVETLRAEVRYLESEHDEQRRRAEREHAEALAKEQAHWTAARREHAVELVLLRKTHATTVEGMEQKTAALEAEIVRVKREAEFLASEIARLAGKK